MTRCSIVLALIAACGSSAAPPPGPGKPRPEAPSAYRATIRWTEHGIPHVVADGLASLAFGQGYAFATLHACVLADQIIRLRSGRALLFGPGEGNANIESDFGWLALDVRDQAKRGIAQLSADARALLRGFADGYNRYLVETGPAGLPPECANAAWVRPIDEVDLLSHWLAISVIGSTGYFLDSIAAAQPPGMSSARSSLAAPPERARSLAARVELPDLRAPDAPASNGWAIGADRSETGRGMLVANPHFPWEGELRFYEAHLTIPGSLDVYGATLLGLPLITIGFTDRIAWTHTFSSSSRFVIYRLALDDADPTRYRYGDEVRALTSRELAIKVKQPDGTLLEVKRRAYRSHYGPILANAQLPWTAQYAYTIRDVAGGGTSAIDQYLAMARAKDRAAFEAALAKWQSTGFVNTIYADRDGDALYVDGSAVPDLSQRALAALAFARRSMPALAEAWKKGVVLADGSMPMFELADDPAVPRRGAIAYAQAPRLLRRDFVANANDPYWLANPAAPLTGFSPLYGEAGQQPSARTRMNLRLLTATGDDAPPGRDGKFSVAELQAAILDNRASTAELLRAPVVARCQRAKPPDARIARACATLAAWDGRYDVASRGAVIWRQLLAAYPGSMFAEPFDPAHPLDTPRGLAPAPKKGEDPVIAALRTAIDRLDRAGIDPSSPLGDVQWTEKAGKRFPIMGSGAAEGATNPTFFSPRNATLLPRMSVPEMIDPVTGLAKGGYPSNYGTSFLLVVGFTDTGPTARAILTYAQSSDPRSPWHSDQTVMYGKKEWRTVRFTDADIAADPALRVQTITGP
jgi:acyl-homoserine-lactone acylase